ncbi:MAG: Gfo/Idh/MocA family oxidoreductase [Planctomycetes bacterium]|nr:Gfo/Idh/MocA family oxidoreductase [Planctomycetota bacterium]
MSRIRLGYVGCGFMAQKVHLPNIVGLADECELVALAEVRPKLGKLVQERLRIPRLYQSHLDLAKDKDIQAVAVSAQYAVQGDIAIDLLRAGKDVLVEKPMAISVVQAERILAAERTSGKRLMVAYMKRYDPGNRVVHDLLARKELGRVRFVRNHGFGGDWTGGLDTPMDSTDEAYPGNASEWPTWLPEAMRKGYVDYLQQYTHNVNLIRWFLGLTDGVRVLSANLDPADGWRGVVMLDAGGVPITIESGWVDFEGWDEHTQIYCDGGWIRTEAPPLLLRNAPATVEVYKATKEAKTRTSIFPNDGRAWAYKEEMRHFIASVRDGTPFRSPASDTIHDVALLEDIYKAVVAARGATQARAAG